MQEVLRGVILGRAGGFVHTLKGTLHAHSPPDEEVVVKETDNLPKRGVSQRRR